MSATQKTKNPAVAGGVRRIGFFQADMKLQKSMQTYLRPEAMYIELLLALSTGTPIAANFATVPFVILVARSAVQTYRVFPLFTTSSNLLILSCAVMREQYRNVALRQQEKCKNRAIVCKSRWIG